MNPFRKTEQPKSLEVTWEGETKQFAGIKELAKAYGVCYSTAWAYVRGKKKREGLEIKVLPRPNELEYAVR